MSMTQNVECDHNWMEVGDQYDVNGTILRTPVKCSQCGATGENVYQLMETEVDE